MQSSSKAWWQNAIKSSYRNTLNITDGQQNEEIEDLIKLVHPNATLAASNPFYLNGKML